MPTDDDGLEEILAVLRDPRIPLQGEEWAANAVLARGCKACLRAEHPYWHQAGSPCPVAATTMPASKSERLCSFGCTGCEVCFPERYAEPPSGRPRGRR